MTELPDINNVATFCGFGTGSAHYRCAMPARALGEGLFVRDDKTLEITREIGTRNAAAVIYSQPWLDFQIAECAQVIKGGGKLIVDCDDDLRAAMGKTDLPASLTEDRVKLWEQLLQQAHLVTCSTQHIADTLTKRLGVKTMVCPNAIDLDRFNIEKLPRNKESVVIGWSGGAGHLEAFERIAPAINKVLDARDDVLFVSLGNPAPDVLPSSLLDPKHVENNRVADAGWQKLYAYPAIMSQFHIGLAPAVDNDFYRGKSDIRFLEYAASYVYTIGQQPTYDIPVGGGVELRADAATDDWVEAIMQVIANPKERYVAGKRARKYVKDHRGPASLIAPWRAAIDYALEQA